MKNQLILMTLIIIQIFATSCGVIFPENNSRRYDRPTFEGAGFDECINSDIPELEIVDEIVELESRAIEYFEKVKSKNSLTTIYYRESRKKYSNIFTTINPLRLSIGITTRDYRNIEDKFSRKTKISQIYEEIVNFGNDLPDLNNNELKEFTNILANLTSLKNQSLRLKNNYCKKRQLQENKKYNILPYISSNKWAESNNEASFFTLAKNELNSNLYNYFFTNQTKSSGLEISCKKVAGRYELNISLYETNMRNRNRIARAINKYWKSDIAYFKFHNAGYPGNNVLRVNQINSYSSYVEKKSLNVINLGIKNSANYQTLAMAHEFGHTVGFNDCYVEYYDSNVDQYIYYILNKRNMMCTTTQSTNPVIPSEYMKQLVRTHCGVNL